MASRAVALPEPTASLCGDRLPTIYRIPPWHGVVAATARDDCSLVSEGEVIVFDEHDHELIEGGIYVLEWQHPIGGASWETARRLDIRRIDTRRIVCRLTRRATGTPGWWIHPLRAAVLRSSPIVYISDGPYDDCNLHDVMLGRVVGLYQPAPLKAVR